MHELLIIVFVTVTTPISLMVLVRAAVFRDESENEGTLSTQSRRTSIADFIVWLAVPQGYPRSASARPLP